MRVEHIINNLFLKAQRFIRRKLRLDEERPHIARRNRHRSPRYYVIRRNPPGAGFFSNYFYVMGHVLEALERGLVPVVDMQNYMTLYNELEPVCGTRNAWEYFFTQQYSIEEAFRSRNYILSDNLFRERFMPYEESEHHHRIVPEKADSFLAAAEQFARLRPELAKEVDRLEAELLSSHVVLGIHYRGTDKHQHWTGHYVTPQLQKYLKAAQELLRTHRIDRVLLCTDEADAGRILREHLPCPVVSIPAHRSDSEVGIHKDRKDDKVRPLHRYLLGVEVIQDAWLLARCKFLIYGHSNVTNMSLLLNGGNYRETRFIS